MWNIFLSTTEKWQVLRFELPEGGRAKAPRSCEGGAGGCTHEIGVCRGLCDSGRALKRGFVGKMKLQALLDRLARSHFRGCLELHFLDGALKSARVISYLQLEALTQAPAISLPREETPDDPAPCARNSKGNERKRLRK